MDMPIIRKGLNVIAALLLAGAYASPNAAGATAVGVAGIYAGSTTNYRYPGPTASTSRPLFGAVATDGDGYFVSVRAASDIRLFRDLRGKGRITSPEYEVPAEGVAVARGPQNWKIEIEPVSGGMYALHGKFNNVSGYVALDLKMQPLTYRDVSLDKKGGVYRGIDINRHTKAVITLAADGQLTGSDAAGCNISGTLNRVENLGLFTADVTFAGAPVCHGAMRGVAFFDTRDRSGELSGAAGSYLYLIGTNGDFSHGFAMALSRQGK